MAQKLTAEAAAAGVAQLEGWSLSGDARSISRRWEYKSFAPALRLANLAGAEAEARGHHPDIRLGWGYCEVMFTTHDAGGLTQADLDAAAGLNERVTAAD